MNKFHKYLYTTAKHFFTISPIDSPIHPHTFTPSSLQSTHPESKLKRLSFHPFLTLRANYIQIRCSLSLADLLPLYPSPSLRLALMQKT